MEKIFLNNDEKMHFVLNRVDTFYLLLYTSTMSSFFYKILSVIGMGITLSCTKEENQTPNIENLYKKIDIVDEDLQIMIKAVYNASCSMPEEKFLDQNLKNLFDRNNITDINFILLYDLQYKLFQYFKKLLLKLNKITNLDYVERIELNDITRLYTNNAVYFLIGPNLINDNFNQIQRSFNESYFLFICCMQEFYKHIDNKEVINDFICCYNEVVKNLYNKLNPPETKFQKTIFQKTICELNTSEILNISIAFLCSYCAIFIIKKLFKI